MPCTRLLIPKTTYSVLLSLVTTKKHLQYSALTYYYLKPATVPYILLPLPKTTLLELSQSARKSGLREAVEVFYSPANMIFCALQGLAICGLLGLFLEPASAQQAPNGSVGTIDFRYPDYIVSPRVECPFEGVFPHPRDCKWFYRCYDTFGFGFYWRAYFECEPGTAFSDGLDQCVFQGDGNTCVVEEASSTSCREQLWGCREADICSPSSIGSSFMYKTEVCDVAQTVCPGTPDAPFCEPGYLYDTGNRQCIEEGALCQPSTPRPLGDFPLTCQDELSQCFDTSLCLQGQSPRMHRFCNVWRKCYHQDGRTSTTNKCPEQQLFDVFSNECIDLNTIRNEDKCSEDIGFSQPLQCVVESESCSVYQSCETRESFLGCVSTFMCGASVPRSNVCPYGAVYVSQTNKCIHITSSRFLGQPTGGIESPCTFTNIASPTLPPTPPVAPVPPVTPTPPVAPVIPANDPEYPPLPLGFDDVNDYISQYQCSREEEKPTAPRHKSLRCKDITRCFPWGEKITYNVCQMYFVCKERKRRIVMKKRNCGKRNYFEFSSDVCKPLKDLPGSDCSIVPTQPPFQGGSTPSDIESSTQGGLTSSGTESSIQGGLTSSGTESSTQEELIPSGTESSTEEGSTLSGTESSTQEELTSSSTESSTQEGLTTSQTPSPTQEGSTPSGEGSSTQETSPPVRPVNGSGPEGLPFIDKPTTVVPPVVNTEVTVPVNSIITCTHDGEIAQMDDIAMKNNCEKKAICSNGIYVRMERHCSLFYTCFLQPNSYNLVPQETRCNNTGEVFFPDKKKCEVPAGELCNLRFYYWMSHRNAYEMIENTPETIDKITAQENLWHRAQIQEPNYVSQFQQGQNAVFSRQQQLQNYDFQKQSDASNSAPQYQYNSNIMRQQQHQQAAGGGRNPHNTINLHAPMPQQIGIMSQKHEQAPQHHLDGTFLQHPAVKQTLLPVPNVQKSVYSQPQFRQNNVSPLALFSGQEMGDQGLLNPKIFDDSMLANQQPVETIYSNTAQTKRFKKDDSSSWTSDGQRFNYVQHHSNPGIPNHALMAQQRVEPQHFSGHPSIGNENNFSNRISHKPELQQQPARSFQQQYPFLENIQNRQNEINRYHLA
ncbi:Chitin binding domain [Trinorchestia longiramus]|nr:Chitin binding domain [Trinorchestia longiramus]